MQNLKFESTLAPLEVESQTEIVDEIETVEKKPEGNLESAPLVDNLPDNEKRRGFLLGSVRASLGLLITGLAGESLAKENNPEKSRESLELRKRILEMNKLAIEKDTEVARMLVEEEGKVSWIDVDVGSKFASAVLDTDKITSVLDANPDSAILIHTHPMNLIKRGLQNLNVRNVQASQFRIPPSLADILSAYNWNKFKDENGSNTELSFLAVDHTGVWDFDAPTTSSFAKLMYREKELTLLRNNDALELLKDTQVDELKESLEHIRRLEKNDPRLVEMYLDQDFDNFYGSNKNIKLGPIDKELIEIRKKLKSNEDYKWITQFDLSSLTTSADPVKQAEMHSELIRRYRKLGIKLSYEPIEKFKE